MGTVVIDVGAQLDKRLAPEKNIWKLHQEKSENCAQSSPDSPQPIFLKEQYQTDSDAIDSALIAYSCCDADADSGNEGCL